jgi:hypothetical protein
VEIKNRDISEVMDRAKREVKDSEREEETKNKKRKKKK